MDISMIANITGLSVEGMQQENDENDTSWEKREYSQITQIQRGLDIFSKDPTSKYNL